MRRSRVHCLSVGTSRRVAKVAAVAHMIACTSPTVAFLSSNANIALKNRIQIPITSSQSTILSSRPSSPYSSRSLSTKLRNDNTYAAVGRQPKRKPMPIVGYDAQEICDYYDRSPLIVGWRLNTLSLPLLGWYIGLLTDKLFKRTSASTQRKRGAQLRQHLANSGSVALIKSGQALSLRPDILKNQIWAEELGKLVDEVGSFSDDDAMDIMSDELSDLLPRIRSNVNEKSDISSLKKNRSKWASLSRLERKVASDPVLSLFEFDNLNRPIASASIGQVYKAKIKRGAALEAAIGKNAASEWGGKTVAIKVQRPDASVQASLDMYLIRRTALWASKFRGGDLCSIADTFGRQLFGELDYVRESNNCERFRDLYSEWGNVIVPKPCTQLTRKKVLVMEWVDGEKGPWRGNQGIDMVSMGLKCSVDQLLNTGLFHSDPHRGNLLRTPEGKLAWIDFGMMADVSAEERYGLVGLAIGLQNKDLPLVTENLLTLGFLDDTTQLDQLVPRLRQALINSTGGSGKASDVNFSQLQAELDDISRENVLKFKTPAFFTVIIRSLTMLEGFALSVDPNFRLVRGSYPYVLAQLLSDERGSSDALQKLLVRLLTVNGEEKEIEWERLRDFLRLAQKAQSNYNPSDNEIEDDKATLSRQTIDLFFRFMTSKTGLFLKKPLVRELAETIDGMASIGESNLLRISRGLFRPLPGGMGPVNKRRMEELSLFMETIQSALVVEGVSVEESRARVESLMAILNTMTKIANDNQRREELVPVLQEVISVFQLVALEVLERRGSRALRRAFQLTPT